ncbi:UDP-2,4-diacetamido-2,4,6-trideoxy-beta-L-altropyranose hydrolase [Thioclava sp. DLFJ5-1]|uniref:UDP-2,4-diacetamido-2,4, 6-trideoxy-beta-L-altropyranose hydrolase n=1 Tax=Thioclava sp. DLFJ5-1 TaxID=1915314 RepID=UPI00248BC530|nr:UDP-2,4-diacetamido-2,4,6-trideoxy-beta-L-altropyranose hydrolase [Thioclava sp. DLFJ5-1]
MISPNSPLRVAFRTDAAIEIGTGHVMRCLTLAAALRDRGADCVFICRQHDGHLLDFIAKQGYEVFTLPRASEVGPANQFKQAATEPPHAYWLGTSWEADATASQRALEAFACGGHIDWLVVDHYALDARWEKALRPSVRRLMVIDDLADRPHECDLLLDQSLGRQPEDYAGLVPLSTTLLLGPRYALLRPEFAELRAESLARRAQPKLRRLLVTMGGIDKDNTTERVLNALDTSALPSDVRITVVMGPQAPWIAKIRSRAERMRHTSEVRVGVSDMARVMTESDLAIGAGGTTTWERCALGLPSVTLVLAKNQEAVAEMLHEVGAGLACYETDSVGIALRDGLYRANMTSALAEMSRAAANVTDGKGATRVLRQLVSMDA